jgi:uncharacterized membrane protein
MSADSMLDLALTISIDLIAGIFATLGLLLLLIPYKPFEKTSPSLAKFIKTGSVSLILVALGAIASLVSFVLTLMTALKVRDTINQIGGGMTLPPNRAISRLLDISY